VRHREGDLEGTPGRLRAALFVAPASILASRSLLGSGFKLTQSRGRPIESDLAPYVSGTVHPSLILRQREDADRHAERRAFTRDLEKVAAAMFR
jgi:DNA polymerase